MTLGGMEVLQWVRDVDRTRVVLDPGGLLQEFRMACDGGNARAWLSAMVGRDVPVRSVDWWAYGTAVVMLDGNLHPRQFTLEPDTVPVSTYATPPMSSSAYVGTGLGMTPEGLQYGTAWVHAARPEPVPVPVEDFAETPFVRPKRAISVKGRV